MVQTNHAEYPGSGGRPRLVHDDLMIICRIENGEVRADYYDTEGHVIHYSVDTAQSGEITFRSDPSAAGPGYRLKYKLRQDGAVQGEFVIAPPGTPGAFKVYLSWEMRKQPKAQ